MKADSDQGILPGGVALPARAPWLGPLEPYFLGGGVAGAGGDTAGVWDYLIGPGYTFHGYVKAHESFLESEAISIVVDGEAHSPDFGMRRVHGTGMFHGEAVCGGVRAHVIDFAGWGLPWVCRLVRMENLSAGKGMEAEAVARLAPSGVSHSVVDGRAVTIAHACDDALAPKHATVGFAGAAVSAGRLGDAYALRSGPCRLSPKGTPGDSFTAALLHHTHREGATPRQWAEFIDGRNEGCWAQEAGRCVGEWQAWFREGTGLDALDERLRDALEGALAIIRMLQGQDGGIMATPRSYMDSYIRDSAGAIRGLTAFGFAAEAQAFLGWAHRKFTLHNAIVCNANIGDDANWFPGYGNADNWAAESTALYLLAARDYLHCMRGKSRGDEALAFLRRVEGSLRYAVDVQLESLVKNGWKLRFNGDETEIGGAGIALADKPDLDQYWSMPSLALCASSLAFYIQYLSGCGMNPAEYTNGISSRKTDLHSALSAVMDSLDDNFWRTDLPEYPRGIYDWYRTAEGGWPRLRITNFALFPLCYQTPLNRPERAETSAMAMKAHFTDAGFLPIQPGGLNADFCGHNLGYLLHALAVTGDPMAGDVFHALTAGGSMGCWGTWCEAYTGDGAAHRLPGIHSGHRVANMRPFETGINIAAISAYLRHRKGAG